MKQCRVNMPVWTGNSWRSWGGHNQNIKDCRVLRSGSGLGTDHIPISIFYVKRFFLNQGKETGLLNLNWAETTASSSFAGIILKGKRRDLC